MSTVALNWAWNQECPSTAAKCVLLAMADSSNDERECLDSLKTLALKCSSAERTVHRHIAELIRLGLVVTHRQSHEDGGQAANLFQLQLTAPGGQP